MCICENIAQNSSENIAQFCDENMALLIRKFLHDLTLLFNFGVFDNSRTDSDVEINALRHFHISDNVNFGFKNSLENYKKTSIIVQFDELDCIYPFSTLFDVIYPHLHIIDIISTIFRNTY